MGLTEEDTFIPPLPYKTVPKPSTLGFKYSDLRDHPLHSGRVWLLGKRADDGAEGLWRVHDGLYDLSAFVEKHPGGSEWITLTKGTDITEAFETQHISTKPEDLLSKFYVRAATLPRNSPFTFKEDGFYKTLKRKIQRVYKTIPQWPIIRSKIIADLLLLAYVTTSLFSVYIWSFTAAAIAGILLSLTTVAAHNFFHQKNNFRMYYFDFSFLSSRTWRISHAMSHHLYTNTIQDLEITSLEPFLQYLPVKKAFFYKYISWFYSPIVYSLIFFGSWVKNTIDIIWTGKGYSITQGIPFVVPAAMFAVTHYSLHWIALMYIWILLIASSYFGLVGLNAGHHHPNVFHDGDAAREKEELDWGIHQMDAIIEREDISGSHFLVLTSFGDHALHHLFPTLDHGVLEYLYPILKETCEQYGIELKTISQLPLIHEQLRQLAKSIPTKEPPKPILKIGQNQ